MEALIHEHCELESYSSSDIDPVELSMQSRQTATELSSVADDVGTRIHHSLQFVCLL